jgi:hypothetical protein
MNRKKAVTELALVATLGAGLAFAVPALAQQGNMEGQGMMGDGMMAGGDGPGMMMDGRGGPMFDVATLDADKDGKVTKAEVDAARQARVAAADANADGKLNAQELAAIEIARSTARANARAARMIEELDADGDGMLTVAEVIVFPVPDRMFDQLDEDGDGAVTQEEIDAMHDKRGGHRGGYGRKGGWFGGDN